MGIVKVTDANTGKLKRYESHDGKPLAKVVNGKLQITLIGQDEGLIVKNNKLVYYHSGDSAY